MPFLGGLFRAKGHYQKEKGLLDEAQHVLRDTIDSVELRVRKAFQTVLERRRELAIGKERVAISKERLRIKERLKELGTD